MSKEKTERMKAEDRGDESPHDRSLCAFRQRVREVLRIRAHFKGNVLPCIANMDQYVRLKPTGVGNKRRNVVQQTDDSLQDQIDHFVKLQMLPARKFIPSSWDQWNKIHDTPRQAGVHVKNNNEIIVHFKKNVLPCIVNMRQYVRLETVGFDARCAMMDPDALIERGVAGHRRALEWASEHWEFRHPEERRPWEVWERDDPRHGSCMTIKSRLSRK